MSNQPLSMPRRLESYFDEVSQALEEQAQPGLFTIFLPCFLSANDVQDFLRRIHRLETRHHIRSAYLRRDFQNDHDGYELNVTTI